MLQKRNTRMPLVWLDAAYQVCTCLGADVCRVWAMPANSASRHATVFEHKELECLYVWTSHAVVLCPFNLTGMYTMLSGALPLILPLVTTRMCFHAVHPVVNGGVLHRQWCCMVGD